jgi:hypothetical protein
MSNRKHWVNLERNEKFAKDGIPSKNHMSAWIGVKVKFREIWGEDFKMRIVPWPPGGGNKNAAYTDEERKRNRNFKFHKIPLQHKEGKDKKAYMQEGACLKASGGDQYKIEAKYGETVKVGPTILETWRRLFYEPIYMQGIASLGSLSGFEDAFRNEKEKFNIELKQVGGGKKMKFMKTVGTHNSNEFRAAARRAYTIGDHQPYAVAVVFCNYLADKVDLVIDDEVEGGIPGKLFHWNEEYSLTVDVRDGNGKRYLWYGMDDADDRKKEWLIGAEFSPESGGPPIGIPAENVTVAGSPKYSLGGYSSVTVKFTEEILQRKLFSTTKLKGTLRLLLNVVDGFSLGWSYNVLNLIVVATKSRWEPLDLKDLLPTLVHEMGHKVGMVADGKGNSPDKPADFYHESADALKYDGHVGRHCKKGCVYHAGSDSWTGAPGCVMFGADAVGSNPAPGTFCPECGKIVRKLDLDGSKLEGMKNPF